MIISSNWCYFINNMDINIGAHRIVCIWFLSGYKLTKSIKNETNKIKHENL